MRGVEGKRFGVFSGEALHEFWQEQRLVDHGRAHVHVEDRRAEGHLLGGEPHGEAVFPGLQFRLQIFLARGIDAFADDLERLGGADAHQPGAGGQHDAGRRHRRGGTGADGVDGPAQGRDVIRGRAAAAAHKPRAHADEGRRLFGERLGGQAEHGLAVHQLGQARVGLGQHRHGRTGEEALHERGHLLGPEAAVQAERVHAEVLHGFRENFRGRPGEARPLLEGHGNHDRQVAFGPDGGHGNAHFRQIELRFDEEQIHAAFHKAARLFAQGFIQLQRVQVPKRTHELPARPHVAGDEGFPAGGVHGGAGDPGHRAVERRDVDARRKLETRAAEGARQNDVRARGEVVGVDPPEHVRPIEAELFRVFPGGQAPCLQHGPHAPVEQQGTPGGECATKIRHAVLLYGILPLHGRAGLEWLVNRSPHQTARALPLGFCLLKIVEKDKPKL